MKSNVSGARQIMYKRKLSWGKTMDGSGRMVSASGVTEERLGLQENGQHLFTGSCLSASVITEMQE